MVIAPTRELAVQIENEAILLGRNLGFKICSFYGGVGYGRQEQFLNDNVDIMIGTPGRILDFKKSGKINFKEIGIFVIDEADRLFDMGFLPDITNMLRSLSSDSARRIMLFSATLSREARGIAREYMDNPVEIEIEPEQVAVDAISQELYHVSKNEKMSLLLGVLKKENPKNALIFTNMKDEARVVAERLQYNGYTCEFLSGDLPQGKRSKIVEDVKNGKILFLVATDVAARGIHIDDLELVINYDIPEHCENYVHRIGRTARAGKTGKAISLACEDYLYGLKSIEDFTKVKIPIVFADSDMYVEDKSVGKNVHQYTYKKISSSRDGFRSSSRGKSSGGNRSDRRTTSQGHSSHNDRPYERPHDRKHIERRDEPKRKVYSNPHHSRDEYNDHPEYSQHAESHSNIQHKPVAHVIHEEPIRANHSKQVHSGTHQKKRGWFEKIVIKIFG
jgi:ATP-dependent RNA helicase RhlB